MARRGRDDGPLDFLDAVLAIHISGIFGILLNEGLAELGLKLPLFVTCLFAGILITNLIPKNFPHISGTRWPTRTPSMALIAEMSLGAFLAMSLMSMQLWTLIDLAGPLLTFLTVQFVLAVAINIFVVFPAMGRNYDAAVRTLLRVPSGTLFFAVPVQHYSHNTVVRECFTDLSRLEAVAFCQKRHRRCNVDLAFRIFSPIWMILLPMGK